ncbi:MAG: hypothetical protein ACYC4U_33095 [Pirellulaceae bacterium]
MNARTKLNSAHVVGSIVVAAVVGGLAGSWPVFFVVTAILLGLSFYDGSIRLRPRRK